MLSPSLFYISHYAIYLKKNSYKNCHFTTDDHIISESKTSYG